MNRHSINSFRVHIVKIPTKAVHAHGIGDVAAINSVLLELGTRSGFTGWGEASPWPAFSGTVEGAAMALHKHLRQVTEHADPVQTECIMRRAETMLVGHAEAKAALESALLDLTGKITALPVAELLGGRHRDKIPLSFSVANPEFEKDLDQLEFLWEHGVRLFKIKTGFSDHAFDLMRLEKLRNRYGEKARLRVDYNQGLPAFDAIRRIRDLEAFRPDFVEQPVKRHEKEALAAITRTVDVPIMADEAVFNPGEALQAATSRIADIFSLKIMKSGGIRRALEVAAIARASGIAVYGGCMFETSVAHLAGAHLMAAVPDLELGCEFYQSTYFAETDIAADPFPVHNGFVHVPRKTGLGFEPNPVKLAECCVESM